MAKTKRINLIAKGKKALTELFNIKVRKINRTISSAIDIAEEHRISSEEEILKRINLLGEAETDEQRQKALNDILESIDAAEQWKLRKEQIIKIQAMLDEEVDEPKD